MPRIEISESNFKKLQKLAVPLVDDNDALIGRLATAALAGEVYQRPVTDEPPLLLTGPRDGGPFVGGLEKLAHTTLLTAKFGRTSVTNPSWNALLRLALQSAYEVLGSVEELRHVSAANIRAGRYEKRGYQYVDVMNASIQGVAAPDCWQKSLLLARAIKVPIEVRFQWTENQKAAHPGQKRILAWRPDAG